MKYSHTVGYPIIYLDKASDSGLYFDGRSGSPDTGRLPPGQKAAHPPNIFIFLLAKQVFFAGYI